jgi:hypothetical protein
VGFVVDEVPLGQVFLRKLRSSAVNIIPPLLIYIFLPERQKERSLGTFKESNALSEIGGRWIEKYFHFFRP